MNDIIQKDVKTYVQNLISETFGSGADDTKRQDRQQKVGNRENPHSKPNQPKEARKG